MQKDQVQNHSIDTFYYAISRILERASFYGFRSLVILYMIGETLKMESTDALEIYGLLVGSLLFSQIVGAVFGDLLIGNKKAMIVGAVIQAIGSFIICIPSNIGLYMGLVLVVLGSGFYTPNITSNFGKLYLNKTKLLDAGFTLFYLAINIGSFLGILAIGYLADHFDYQIGFMASGILMLLSIIPILISKEAVPTESTEDKVALDKRIIKIAIAFLAVGLFWASYELANFQIFDLQLQFGQSAALQISQPFWQSMDSLLNLPVSLVAIIVWSYFYSNPFFKLLLGFLFGVLSFGILIFLPQIPTELHAIAYLISLFFLAISEIHVAPIIYSILTKYANPKYLAILISLAFVPTRLITLLFGLFNDKVSDNPISGVLIGIIIIVFAVIGLSGYVWWNKKTTRNPI